MKWKAAAAAADDDVVGEGMCLILLYKLGIRYDGTVIK